MAVSRTNSWTSGGTPHELTTLPLNPGETQEHLDQRHATALEFFQGLYPPDE